MKTILRLLLCCLCTVSLVLPLAAASADEGEKSALTLRANALQKESVRESLKYLTSHIQLAKNDAEKRSILYYTATLQETLGQFVAAAATYAQAAAINADNAQGMPAASNAELYLYAARSSLEACDFQSADSYLDASPVNSSTDKTLIARKRLLSAWSALCKAGDYREVKGVVANLEEFAGDGQLADIRCEVLFTLWYVTEDEQWRSLLKKDYPHRPETAIAEGSGSVMAMPFWYFMPRASLAADGTASGSAAVSAAVPAASVQDPQGTAPKAEAASGSPSAGTAVGGRSAGGAAVTGPAADGPAAAEAAAAGAGKKPARVREQIGFFRKLENAEKLVERAAKSGFTAYYYTELRSSGTEYYIVVVDEDEGGSMGNKLRNAGFDCYPIKN